MSSAPEPALKLFIYAFAGLLIITLAIVLSPFVLVAGVILGGIRIYDWYQTSPGRLAKLEAEKHALLYQEAAKPVAFPDSDTFAFNVLKGWVPNEKTPPIPLIVRYFLAIFDVLYQDEAFDTLPNAPTILSGIEGARYRDLISERLRRTQDPARTLGTMELACRESLSDFHKLLPAVAKTTPDKFQKDIESEGDEKQITIPLLDLMPDIGKAVETLALPFFSEDITSLNLFAKHREKLERNQHEMSGLPFDSSTRHSTKLVMPTDSKEEPRQIVRGYLKDTVFEELFDLQIPFEIPMSRFLEHAVLVAGSGHGKTQTLGALIARFVQMEEPLALVVLDSTGALVKKIQHLALFNAGLRDRILIIDPEHEPVPALNMFDISNPRFKSYSRAEREGIETEIVNLFGYVFSAIDNPLTDPMRTALSYMVKLLLTIPGANITTFRNLLEENNKGGYIASAFKPFVERLDPELEQSSTRDFFKLQFFTERVSATKASILQRLSSILTIGAFERMFSTTNKVDFYDELQNKGSIILVNTSERILKEKGSPLFGRYIIARTMASAFERASIPERTRRPTLLIVDEAAPYFDDSFDKLWTRVRQFKLGVCVAFQHMEQTNEKLRSAIASNTSVKMAGGLGYGDSRWLSRDMEASPEFLKAQVRDDAEPPKWTQLACYVRNFTPKAVSITVPFYVLENMPQMTTDEHRALLERNRVRVSNPPKPSEERVSQPQNKATETIPDPPKPSVKTTAERKVGEKGEIGDRQPTQSPPTSKEDDGSGWQ